MYEDMKGKTALITGAGKRTGMGYGIARRMASLGTNIIIADLGEKGDDYAVNTGLAGEMDDIATGLSGEFGVRTLAVGVDICDSRSVARMADAIREKFERIDILCNNAGAAFGVPSTLNNYDEGMWLKTIDVNLNGTFRVTRAVLPMMYGKPGSIVNTASRAAKFPAIFNGAYAVAKAGVIQYTKVLAKEIAGAGIRVNAICPGQIDTDLLKWQLELEAQFYQMSIEERRKHMCGEIPVGFIGEVRDVASLVVFLASEESRFMTGQAINITGGQLMEL